LGFSELEPPEEVDEATALEEEPMKPQYFQHFQLKARLLKSMASRFA